jgi:N-[(2S)-2-amino-2-carboxyethyl]-L-glutamate dehydrogenase
MKQNTNYPEIDFLYLNEQDMIKAGVEDMAGCIDTMDELFSLIGKGDYRMGGPNGNEHGIMMKFPKESDVPGMPLLCPDYRFVAMPAYVGGAFRMCGIKCYGSNQSNREKELPRSILMLTLMDMYTGAPLAYMSANVLSAMRTGAVPGLGVRYLSVKEPETVTIVGPGVMGRTSMLAFTTVKPCITTVKIKGRGQKGIDDFITFCKEKCPNIKNFIQCGTEEEACRDSDIVYFGTTNAPSYDENPYADASWLKPGALVMSASALRMDHDFLADTSRCKLVSDNSKMYEGWAEGAELPVQKSVSTLLGMAFYDVVAEGRLPKSGVTDIGDIINKKASGRTDEDQIIVYAVGGMPVEDVAWGCKVMQKAREKGIGTQLNLWNKPEFA